MVCCGFGWQILDELLSERKGHVSPDASAIDPPDDCSFALGTAPQSGRFRLTDRQSFQDRLICETTNIALLVAEGLDRLEGQEDFMYNPLNS